MVVTRRAQIAGRIRTDLVPDDLHRITVMLLSVLHTVQPGSAGWKRYLTLMLDGLAPAQPTVLPPPEPLRQWPTRGSRTCAVRSSPSWRARPLPSSHSVLGREPMATRTSSAGCCRRTAGHR